MCGCLSHGDLAFNPGMCPDWESNQQTLGSPASTQSTDPHQPGLSVQFLNVQFHLQSSSYGSPVVLAQYIFLLIGLGPHIKNQLAIYISVYFWTLYVCPYASTIVY